MCNTFLLLIWYRSYVPKCIIFPIKWKTVLANVLGYLKTRQTLQLSFLSEKFKGQILGILHRERPILVFTKV